MKKYLLIQRQQIVGGYSFSCLLVAALLGVSCKEEPKKNSSASSPSTTASPSAASAQVSESGGAIAKMVQEPQRKPDLSGSVVTLIDGQEAECLDLKLWGEEPLQDFEVAAWREAFLPQDDATTRNLKRSCGEEYAKSSPKAVCTGRTAFQREGLNYSLSMTTSHYLGIDLKLRAQECRQRGGRWLQF